MPRQVVGAAGRKQLAQVGEVVVDGQPLHARAARDVGHRRMTHTDLFVQPSRRRRNPLARPALRLSARLQFVLPLLT
jgi:hypothetical protein